MTIATWPVDLPAPERNTWNSAPQDARQKRQSDAGPQTYRRRFSSAAKTVNLSMILSADQRALFDSFYSHETKGGSLLFWMPDPTTDGWALWHSDGVPLLIAGGPDDGKPILLGSHWLCSFGDQVPQETLYGLEFRKTFNVIVIP